jgi:hypothetical protein
MWGRRGRYRMVYRFTTTYAISVYNHYRFELKSAHGQVYSMQHYVIKFVSDLQQVDGVLWFHPLIKLTAMI